MFEFYRQRRTPVCTDPSSTQAVRRDTCPNQSTSTKSALAHLFQANSFLLSLVGRERRGCMRALANPSHRHRQVPQGFRRPEHLTLPTAPVEHPVLKFHAVPSLPWAKRAYSSVCDWKPTRPSALLSILTARVRLLAVDP